MHFSTLATLLLPVAALAAPTPITKSSPNKMAIREVAGVGLRSAQDVLCFIISNDGPVNCRSGPGTNHGVVTTLPRGDLSDYTCWAPGTNIDGNA